MKIAFVHNAFTSYRIPLFNELSKQFDIDFFFHKIYGLSEEKSIFNHKILFGMRFPFIVSDYTFSPFLFINLLRKKYHVFIGAGSGYIDTLVTFLIAKCLRKPFILWDVSWFRVRSIFILFRFPFFRYMALHSDAVVLPGLKSMEFYKSLGIPETKIFRSPNVISLKITSKAVDKLKEIKTNLKIKDDKVVLFFGKILCVKGLEYLIKAYSKLQKEMNVRLIIASSLQGDKNYEKKFIS
ncbi:MAG: hypothetical protein ACTSQY_04590 [Candidatus Odinarchaeia archaeon]